MTKPAEQYFFFLHFFAEMGSSSAMPSSWLCQFTLNATDTAADAGLSPKLTCQASLSVWLFCRWYVAF